MVAQLVIYDHTSRSQRQDKSTTSSVRICFWTNVWMNGIAPFSVSKLSTSESLLSPTRQVDNSQLRKLVRLQEANKQLHVRVVEVAICLTASPDAYLGSSRHRSCPR